MADDYVLGTHDDEIQRLGLQHRVWRPRAMAAWQRAGITVGQTVLDVGCGPGWATLDLAEMVGPTGRVIAVDRSRRFLDVLEARCKHLGVTNVTVVESDLDHVELDAGIADAAWCRWVLAFVLDPRKLLERVTRALKPGGRFIAHEYFDYRTWRVVPRSPEFEEFVATVIDTWRASGGEPDIGLALPVWLDELGLTVAAHTPMVDVITRHDYAWQWLTSFMDIGLERLVDTGAVSAERGARLRDAFGEINSSPHTRMVTPGMLEVIGGKH
jgi:SAM-dependent methyltransferase